MNRLLLFFGSLTAKVSVLLLLTDPGELIEALEGIRSDNEMYLITARVER